MIKYRIGLSILLCIILTLFVGCSLKKSKPIEKQPQNQIEVLRKDATDPAKIVLEEIMKVAEQGMIKETTFNVFNSTIDQVKTEWGEPDQIDQAGRGYYATYSDKNVVFGYKRKGEIFDIRSYSPELQKVTEGFVIDSYGKPAEIRTGTDERIYIYKIGEKLQLKVILSINTKTIDHTSIFNSQQANDTDYLLDIKGESPHLSKKSWNSMMNWRKEILEFSKTQEHVYLNGPNEKRVALTFDDGPDNKITPAIINVLEKYHVKGNFFFLGNQAEKNPDVVKKAHEKGNLVLSHTYSHVELTKLGYEDIRKEITKTNDVIQAIIGKVPALLRTPYGSTNQKVVDVVEEEGNSVILWSIDSLDWAQNDPSIIENNVVTNIRNGDIVLMHSDSDESDTLEALPLIIEALQKQGFEIVDLATLLGVKAYK